MTTKSIVVLTEEALESIEKGQREIISKLEALSGAQPNQEYLTVKEFMAKVKIGRTKFDQLVAMNEIDYIRKGRKIYIPSTEVERYFTK
ncbi:helix-turn-helix domain-containing protein [Roseivirga pacifica]|uniref:helix-turn-helix domain-containing protein n=1 Tax=Roseivirga pacifica TaxID=1267423 RepID=UPI00209460D5|nr:helix-turn-helix domain-containing protein [Roseivirga pacifica]MCO6359026.1 helix-turn-helix domain-containing protein [Roseivirga pacifica]MCO6365338.1 helix-turn-helix domain-containing protein [Roseivirga pacifica]MCO6371932.1 helix-turn-helix domain-containing protein [Roseivirga pacifica]MCO6375957.1 helix-turn-helix domain-containing protein [Roseivirga pacifica]MCO6379310.1 helix-turn-helix domain-containing protein [Roseivirga pacifica]